MQRREVATGIQKKRDNQHKHGTNGKELTAENRREFEATVRQTPHPDQQSGNEIGEYRPSNILSATRSHNMYDNSPAGSCQELAIRQEERGRYDPCL